ncbi:Hypothetical protein R9X50_00521400 [Acrodontium crateriforme]|uniref:Uncharacterized protein n=1 Tax=Acrodontium crateriforme TaxID=150365 RepID=A0AAQ3M969_9PEZI|nr:Hypothetical protein R9X50_00521400 [Acrodontium crateriforme]
MSTGPDLDVLLSQDITDVRGVTVPANQTLENKVNSKRRSHEILGKDLAAMVTGNIDEKTLQPESLTVLSRNSTPPTAPPKTTRLNMASPSQKPPLSGQSCPSIQSPQIESAKAVTEESSIRAKSVDGVHGGHVNERIQDEASPDSPDPDPANQISPFDWEELEEKYHNRVKTWAVEEQKAFQEFSQLCDYFGRWAQTAHSHEVGRGFKRLKTQATFVQHEESELEKKREHYVKVVDAFKRALQLLSG